MAEKSSTIGEVLTRVVARLIDQITDATTTTCYISMDPDRLDAGNPGAIIYVVTPAPSGSFNLGYQDGGGPNQVTTEWPIVVTVHNTYINDQVAHETEFLTNATTGLIPKATLVLKALVTHFLQDAADTPNEILAQPITVYDAAVQKVPSKRRGSMQFGFLAVFDWDLS